MRGLPEFERKSAYCVMMYSFGRQVFPVDTHAGRVLARLGPYRELGLALAKTGTGSESARCLSPFLEGPTAPDPIRCGPAVPTE